MRLRDRRRRESAPVIATHDLDQPSAAGSHTQSVRGARRVSKGSQRAILTSCLSEDSALEGLDAIGEINTPKGSRRNFIELMMSSSPQVGLVDMYEMKRSEHIKTTPCVFSGSQVSDQPWPTCPRLGEERRRLGIPPLLGHRRRLHLRNPGPAGARVDAVRLRRPVGEPAVPARR